MAPYPSTSSRRVKLALYSAHMSLLCLGDLARYKQQIRHTTDYALATRLVTVLRGWYCAALRGWSLLHAGYKVCLCTTRWLHAVSLTRKGIVGSACAVSTVCSVRAAHFSPAKSACGEAHNVHVQCTRIVAAIPAMSRRCSFYTKAQQLMPKNGRPYNQLAILAMYSVSNVYKPYNHLVT